ncbi:MAG: hypothetical protein Q8Q42_02165 [Nanoarchaeota archaeon]|nr:hypothetical protein [Nanoarchaeota archaeon]
MEITVEMLSEDEYFVTVVQDDTKTEHIVKVSDKDFNKLVGTACSKEDLVKKSFEFLLEREPKELIQKKFSIMIISKFFPEYPDVIKKMI